MSGFFLYQLSAAQIALMTTTNTKLIPQKLYTTLAIITAS